MASNAFVTAPRLRGAGGEENAVTHTIKQSPVPPPSRVQGAQPPPGVQGESLFPKTLEGGAGGITAHAKPDPPLKEGAGQDKTIRPHQRADAGVRGPCHTPLANTNNCAMISHEVGSRPASLSRSLPHMFGQGDSLWTPPVAGALREQPKGQDPPRKVGTGANAVIRHRLFGAIPLHYGSITVPLRFVTEPLQILYSSLTVPLRLVTPYYASVTAPRLRGPGEKKKQQRIQSKNEDEAVGNLLSLPLYSGKG